MAASTASSSRAGTSRYRRGSKNAATRRQTDTSAYSTTLPPVVMEFGSSFLRIGLSGEAAPRHIIPTPSKLSTLPHTILKNETKEWDGIIYPLLSHISTNLLLLKNLKSRPVIILEPLVSPTAFRNAICKSLLSWLGAPSVSFVPGSASVVLPYGLGLGQGIVVDVGRVEGRVMVVAGENGRPLMDTFRASPCGIEKLAQNLIDIHNSSQSKSGDISSVQDAIAVLNHYFASGGGDTSSDVVDFTLPSSGQSIQVSVDIIQGCLHETYFDIDNPESLLRSFLSVLLSCPIDLRRNVARNVIFIGGTVEFVPKFERRFLKSLVDTFGPTSDHDATESSSPSPSIAFRSLGPLLADKNGCLGIVHPLPFSPSIIAWTAASVLGTTDIPDDQTVHRKAFADMQSIDPHREVWHDFLATTN